MICARAPRMSCSAEMTWSPSRSSNSAFERRVERCGIALSPDDAVARSALRVAPADTPDRAARALDPLDTHSEAPRSSWIRAAVFGVGLS
jgi:hypothetical protein